MTQKTERFAARIDAETLTMIEDAAKASGMSTSAFVVQAAGDAARRVTAQMDITWVPWSVLSELIATADEPDPWPELERLAARPPRVILNDR